MRQLKQKVLLLGVLMLSIFLMNGCSTKQLWKQKPYREKLSSVLISQDKNYLVFIGRDYHYVFDAPKVLIHALSTNVHDFIHAKIGTFYLDKAGSISGTYTLELKNYIPKELQYEAMDLGYEVKESKSGITSFRYEGQLKGKRYYAQDKMLGKAKRLKRTYFINIYDENDAQITPNKIILTPITLGLDGLYIFMDKALKPVLKSLQFK